MAARWRNVGALVVCLVAAWLALGEVPRIPVLAVADLGFASLGRGAGEVVDGVVGAPVLPALTALVAPVAVPLVLAGRFLRSRAERHAAALCLAWAGTVLTALAVALRQAAARGSSGPGAAADWALLLGRQGLGAIDRSAELAGLLRGGALVLSFAAVAVCAVPLVAEARGRTPRPEPAAARWDGPNRRRI